MSHYMAMIEKGADGGVGIVFPDLPGCVSAADTLDEASTMVAEALALHLAGMREDGLKIPAPRDLDAIAADPDYAGMVALAVPARSRRRRSSAST